MTINKFQFLLAISWCIFTCTAYHGRDLPRGPFCGISGRCCRYRHDGCHHEILGSLCYCDEFCNRTSTHGYDDCCPDFEEVCMGQVPTTTPEPEPVAEAFRRGYVPGDTIKKGCNTCIYRYPDLPESDYWECERDPCIISEKVLQRVNQNRWLGWRAANYTQFFDKKLKDGIIYKLGTLPLSRLTLNLGPIIYDKHISYPTHFDARKVWPKYISAVRDQGWCGSDWAISIASIASDRLAIQSNGAEVVNLSPQTLISCNAMRQNACLGGDITSGWSFVKRNGLMDEDCFPYNTSVPRCPPRFRRGNLISDGCKPAVPLRTSRYKVGPPSRLVKEHDIMYDIMESGPVQAVMTVYQDFFHYRDGIYRRTDYGSNEYKGLHSVKIIGWGEQNGQKYWTVANSWGTEWGEGGYFRIIRGENESGIESFVVSVMSYVNQAFKRK